MNNCSVCQQELSSNYCPNCGRPAQLKRVNGKYIVDEIRHVLHFDHGLLFTIKELLIDPGQSVRSYLTENRNRLVKPILFIILTSLLYTVFNNYFHLEGGYIEFTDDKPSTTVLIFQWVQNHYGYANIIMGVFIALWIKLFFRKAQFNFFEILILLCFLMGMGMLIFAVFGIFQGLTGINIMQFAGMIGLLYSSWGIGQFYGEKRIFNYIKAILAYLLGSVTFILVAIGIGNAIDMIF